MYTLVIDTSNHVLGVSVMNNDRLIGKIVTNLKKNHSTRLMPAVEQLLEEVGMEVEELNRIAVAKGPGSYTGVRIGLTTAKTLAWALDIPIVGVSSLEVLAYQGRFFHGYICPFFDAKRGLVYAGIYEWTGDRLSVIRKDRNILFSHVLDFLRSEGKPVLFLSPDVKSFERQIKEEMGEFAVIPDGPYHIADPAHLGLASLEHEPEEVHFMTPEYLRLAEAEANWLKQQKEKEENG